MKGSFLKLLLASLIFFGVSGMVFYPVNVMAQEAEEDTTQVIQDNSSSFNDSVQFDDMEPIFYEAEEDEVQPESTGSSGIILYVGIAIVLLVVLIVLKKVGKKKS